MKKMTFTGFYSVPVEKALELIGQGFGFVAVLIAIPIWLPFLLLGILSVKIVEILEDRF